MLTRRDLLIGAGALGITALRRDVSATSEGPAQPSTPVNFKVPANACDCHTHVFGDPLLFPFDASRAYTPEQASVAELRSLHGALRTARVVLVQPSVYGTDNACLLNAMKQLDRDSRGIVVIDAKTPDSTLDKMHRAGVRGIRINLETAGQADPALARRNFQSAVDRIEGRNWHIQVYTRLAVIEGIQNQVMATRVPVVFDHFGGTQAEMGTGQPGFDVLLKLVRVGKAYVKISAPYRSSVKGPNYPDLAPIAEALIAANPQRILWGSDWPHPWPVAGRKPTEVSPPLQVDDGLIFNLLPVWAPDPNVRKTILVENPAKLFGF
jgi:predicted TIM-barrel fold metal-dependent hydrolase